MILKSIFTCKGVEGMHINQPEEKPNQSDRTLTDKAELLNTDKQLCLKAKTFFWAPVSQSNSVYCKNRTFKITIIYVLCCKKPHQDLVA